MGHEWKSLVESSRTTGETTNHEDRTDGNNRTESPVGSGKSGGQPVGASAGGGAGEQAEDDARAPRLQNQDIKIDVLRELEDVASMTIAETGFFCK